MIVEPHYSLAQVGQRFFPDGPIVRWLQRCRVVKNLLACGSITTVQKLRFADTDRNGHITNIVLAACCQYARMELQCNPQRVPVPPNSRFAIAKLGPELLLEMHWPGTVVIGTRLDPIGRSSMMLAQALFVANRCVAKAEPVIVLLEVASRRAVGLSEEATHASSALARPHRGTISSRTMSNAAL